MFLLVIPANTTRLLTPMPHGVRPFLKTMFHLFALIVCFCRIIDAAVRLEHTFEIVNNAWFVYAVAFNAKIIVGISQMA